MRVFTPVIALLASVSLSTPCDAADRYVSTTGSNGGPGTISNPWRNIDFAADRANPGDTILVRGGEYRERLTPNRSGNFASRITIKNYPGETPIIDGTGQGVGGQTALVDIGSRSHITLDGFEIRNLITSSNSSTPIGILVDGASVGIEILNCEIYNIRNNGNSGNAHGILCQGTSSTPISNLVVRGNELRDLILGTSEALVLNGNVNGFEVCENYVHDCNNLGIDFIGFEGNGPSGQDQARNGVCADNVVSNISTISNPAYGRYSAGGIYVDGGRDIIIERNRIDHCDIGIELASEASGRATSNITVRNNLLWNNSMGGIFVGGYSPSRGAANDCTITCNTLFENDTLRWYNGEILVQYNTSNLEITNNILIPNQEKDFIVINNGNNSGITLDYNLYYSSFASNPSGSEWIWNGSFAGSFNSWKSISGQDANSIYTNPQLSNPSTADFTIASTSPAREAGDPSITNESGDTDAFGNPRISGNRADIGAHEFVFLSELQQWRQLHFGTTANSGDAADLADPDLDGRINLIEFALANQDPNRATADPLVRVTYPFSPTLEFTRSPEAAAEVIYSVIASPDLVTWSQIASRPRGGIWSSSNGVTISESTGNTIISDLRSNRSSKHFYQLQITIP